MNSAVLLWGLFGLMTAALGHIASPTPGDPSATTARVRVLEPELAGLVQEGLNRSRTFRRLVQRIDESDGIVYVQTGPCTGYVAWHETQCRFLEHLDTLVRAGTGIDFHRTLRDKRGSRDCQRAMLAMAPRCRNDRAPGPHSCRSNTSSRSRRGHGLLGAAICRRHPPMRSTVVDLPEAVEERRVLARETGNADLVDHRAGDLRTDSLEECDAVLLANILHHFIPAEINPLIARVRNALRPRGAVAIWDLESPQRGGPVGHGDVMSLCFRLTSSAAAYHGTDYANWLRDQRFSHVKVVRPNCSPGRVLVIGRTRNSME
jgi:O-methyltransferase domain